MTTRETRLGMRLGENGFTLLEVVIAMALVAVLSISLLAFLGHSLKAHQAAAQRWKSAVELWNRSQRLRVERPDPAGSNKLPFDLDLRTQELEQDGIRWEVLHAGR